MAHLISPPKIHTIDEWNRFNETIYCNTDNEREVARLVNSETDRLDDETDKRTKKTLRDVDKKLEQRLADIKYWQQELDAANNDLNHENDKLNEYLKRLGHALEALDEPLHIAESCLNARQGRIESELVHDEVDKNLLKEIELYKGIAAILNRVRDQTKEQARLNRKAIYNLKKDAADKQQAKSIDEATKELNEHMTLPNSGINCTTTMPHVEVEDWLGSTKQNLVEARQQQDSSMKLRGILDGTLRQIATDQKKHKEDTDFAFRRRIAETRDSKGRMEEQLALLLTEISGMDDTIKSLEKAIADKQGAVNLLNERFRMRDQRSDRERTRDAVLLRMMEERGELGRDLASLNNQLAVAHSQLRALSRRQLDLENAISWKEKTLFIDSVECESMRSSLNIFAH